MTTLVSIEIYLLSFKVEVDSIVCNSTASKAQSSYQKVLSILGVHKLKQRKAD